METKSYQELLDKIKEISAKRVDGGEELYCAGNNDVGCFALECESMCEDYDNENPLFFGEVKTIERSGGYDEGSNWHRIYEFADHGVYIKVNGYYYSHDGTYFEDGWDSVSEVEPSQKIITVYRPKSTK
jgi:hypothetical protein